MNPCTRIWFNPRDTYRSADFDSVLLRFLVIWMWGIVYALDRSVFGGSMIGSSPAAHLGFVSIVGLFGGFFYFWTLAFAMQVTNSWFGGRASAAELRRALALGGLPTVFSLLPYVWLMGVLGKGFFTGDDQPDDMPLGEALAALGLLVAIVVLHGWSRFSTSHAVAEAQGYASAWRAFFHEIVAYFVLGLVCALPFLLLHLMVRA